jgi:type IV secretory pathway TrbL component
LTTGAVAGSAAGAPPPDGACPFPEVVDELVLGEGAGVAEGSVGAGLAVGSVATGSVVDDVAGNRTSVAEPISGESRLANTSVFAAMAVVAVPRTPTMERVVKSCDFIASTLRNGY